MSTKTVAQKLLIKPGTTVWSSSDTVLDLVAPLPDDVVPASELGEADVALLCVESAVSVQAALTAHAGELTRPRALWLLYPKGNATDINRDSLWPMLEPYNLRPVTQVAVDETWSALRFRPLKPGEAPFAPAGSSN